MCERKMTFGGICAVLAICVGLTGAHAADTVIGQIEVKNGAAGTPGATGASAYQIWLANGNTGSEADFLASLVGATEPQGVAGKDGTSVKIKGTVSSCANLPNNADIGDIYMVAAQGNQGYIYDGTSWHCPEAGVNIQGPQGPQGPAGSACLSTVTSQACGPNKTVKCAIQSKSGTIYTKTDCNGQNPTSDTIYNGDDGANGTPGCATTLTKSKTGKVTTLTAKDCNNQTLWSETVSDGSDGTNCVPTFSSAHDAAANKTVLSISGCGQSTTTVDIPDGQEGVGVCDGVTSANLNKTVKNTTSVYTAGTATKVGYLTNTRTMCDETTVTTDKVEDSCVQVKDARTSGACNGAYLVCKNQTTDATYNVCLAITGQNVSSLTSAISAAQSAAENASTAAGAAQQTAASALSTANENKDKINNNSTGLAAAHNAAANALSVAQRAQSTADTAAQNASDALDAAQRAQTTASGHTSQINTLNTTVGIGTAGANSVLGRLGSVETTVNGTCGGGASDSGGCTQGLQAQITSLQSNYSALQRSYNTLSQNYTALQTRVAAMEACSTCAAPKADN